MDIGLLAEAPLCPADHAETSLSDFVLSKDRLQLRTEVLNRVVDAETFPSETQSRPQNSKDCKKDQAALVFHPDAAALALAGKLTGADVPPEEAFHPKRPEEDMMRVVQDNADRGPEGGRGIETLGHGQVQGGFEAEVFGGAWIQSERLGGPEPEHGRLGYCEGQEP